LYSIFDINLNGKIEKEEMRNILHMFVEGFLSVNYDNQNIKELKEKILESHERTIDIALDEITVEIFEKYEVQVMDFDIWKKWLFDQEGFQEVLKYNPHLQFNDTD